MLQVVINWIYILITCYVVGNYVANRLMKGYKVRKAGSVICGFAVLTAYAGYFSLFDGVGLAANIIMLLVCGIFVYVDKNMYMDLLAKLGTQFFGINKRTIIKWGLAFGIVIASAYFTAYGQFAYDTGTYHAQSIHWIESYGVVKGLAYMQTRLGFNSSYFCLCALYSFHDFGKSLHTISGFLAAFVMIYSLFGLTDRSTGRLRVVDVVYLAPFAYFVIIAIELVSPTTDFVTIWLIIWLCIRWLELIEEDGAKGVEPYALLCVLAVFLVSIKLSVGVLAILVIKPGVLLIKEKRWMDIIKYVLAGVLLVLPYFIRNVLITGWLIYPFPAIDLFNVDWKIPVEGVKYEADEIVVWARYTKDVALVNQGISEWFPVWWQEQGQANRYLSLSSFAGAEIGVIRLVVTVIYLAWLSIRRVKLEEIFTEDEIKKQSEYLYFLGVIIVSYLFFILSAPSNRFGYAYILILPLLVCGDCVVNVIMLMKKKYLEIMGKAFAVVVTAACSVCLMIAVCLPMLKGLYYVASDDYHYFRDNLTSVYLVAQKDYINADSECKEWQGINISYPVIEGDQIWYHDFPAILYEGNLEGIERRGNNMKDGFRLKQ